MIDGVYLARVRYFVCV